MGFIAHALQKGWKSLPAEIPQSHQLATSVTSSSQTTWAANPGFVSAHPSRVPVDPVSQKCALSVVNISILLIPLTLVPLIPQNYSKISECFFIKYPKLSAEVLEKGWKQAVTKWNEASTWLQSLSCGNNLTCGPGALCQPGFPGGILPCSVPSNLIISLFLPFFFHPPLSSLFSCLMHSLKTF